MRDIYTDNNQKKVYIIILNYNGWRDTQECLESVLKLKYQKYQIIVVDNNSPNNSMLHLLAWARGEELASVDNKELTYLSKPPSPKPIDYIVCDKSHAIIGGNVRKESKLDNPIIFIQAPENRGFASGNNIGTEYALKKGDADYLWYLNNDCVVDPNSLSQHLKKDKVYKNKKIGIIGSKIMSYHHPKLIQGVGGIHNKCFATTRHLGAFEEDIGQYDNQETIKQINYPIGASMLVRIEFLKDVGMLCEDYFLYFEELDWVCRGRKKGWSLGLCYLSKIYHKEGASISLNSSRQNYNEFSDFHNLTSRLIFTKNNYNSRLILVKFSLILVFLNRIRKLQLASLKTVIKVFLNWKSQ